MAGKQAARGWSFKELVGTVAACSTLPVAFGTTGSGFLALRSAGLPTPLAFAGALASGAATLAVVATGCSHVAAVARDVLEPARGEVRDYMARFAAFFRDKGIPPAHQQVLVSRDRVFCDALARALLASGVPAAVVDAKDAIAIAADARQLGPAASTILALETYRAADRTIVSLKAFGDAAPVAIRRVADGTFAALWADADGTPVKAVGYNRFGEPNWVFRHAEGNLSQSDSDLFDEPCRNDVAETMAAACEAACADYTSLREWMVQSLPETHTMVRDANGTMVVRDAKGKLDNPSGAPAVLAADGTASWVVKGRRVSAPRTPVADRTPSAVPSPA